MRAHPGTAKIAHYEHFNDSLATSRQNHFHGELSTCNRSRFLQLLLILVKYTCHNRLTCRTLSHENELRPYCKPLIEPFFLPAAMAP